ncbi:MAG: hypothetical protein HXX16_02810 [Bacteroidales bacterium]|nr:hypothetical protein [Bacteroidales bacterium]
MKPFIFVAVAFSFSFMTKGQSTKLTVNDLSKVILFDSFSGLDAFIKTQYEITFSNGAGSLYIVKQEYKLPESITFSKNFNLKKTKRKRFLKQLPISVIDSLLKYYNSEQTNVVNLNFFGINKVWIERNHKRTAESLYPAEPTFTLEQRTSAVELFKNPENYRNTILNIEVVKDYYPTCKIQLITKTSDTIKIATDGQGPFLYPWHSQNETDKYFYDPRLSIWFANLIPFEEFSNKKKLKGENFLDYLTSRMFQDEFKGDFRNAGSSFYIRENQISRDSLLKLKRTYGIGTIFNSQFGIYFALGDRSNFYVPSFVVNDISFLQKKDSMKALIDKVEEIKTLFINNSFIKPNFNLIKKLSVEEYSSNTLKKDFSEELYTDLRFINKSLKKLNILLNYTQISVFENDLKSSEWLIDKKGKLILWRYQKELPLNLKSKKFIGKYRADYNMYVVLKEIK